MTKEDKQVFEQYPEVDRVFKVGKDYFLPSMVVAAKITAHKKELELITLVRPEVALEPAQITPIVKKTTKTKNIK